MTNKTNIIPGKAGAKLTQKADVYSPLPSNFLEYMREIIRMAGYVAKIKNNNHVKISCSEPGESKDIGENSIINIANGKIMYSAILKNFVAFSINYVFYPILIKT